ncbi:hypothetical protein KHA80_15900 [Anaerobacillus sp. HL2]|nr:hypothetical protein KHA80_15900 [Anaerobacillus sp. HL2]
MLNGLLSLSAMTKLEEALFLIEINELRELVRCYRRSLVEEISREFNR